MEMSKEAEMREDIERGRRAQIALEVLKEFMDERRSDIINCMECYILEDTVLQRLNVELGFMRRFYDECRQKIQRREIAEEELTKNG